MYEHLGSLINWENWPKKPDQNFTFFSSLLNLNKPSLREGGREEGRDPCRVSLLGEENKRSYIIFNSQTPLYLTSIILHGNK
jgi:hypothetical protein